MGNAATAAVTLAYSPEVVVPALTTTAPEGGLVREVADTDKIRLKSWKVKILQGINIFEGII